MKVIAVVVTYNRLELLKKVLASLMGQSVGLNDIVVVNNSSTDGTGEWLETQQGLRVVTQPNVGGSGGFYTGIRQAYDMGADWIWCMDDDVFPTVSCLENLLKEIKQNVGILSPRRHVDGEVFCTEVLKLNLSNPFRPLHCSFLKDSPLLNSVAPIEGIAFEGPLVSREVVDRIGFPNKDLFILYDDTDYSYRAVLAGFKVLYVPDAILDKHNFRVSATKESLVIKNKWKLWYQLRNTTWFCKTYGENSFYRTFGSLYLYIKMLLAMLKNLFVNKKYQFSDIRMLPRLYRMGLKKDLSRIL